LAQINLLHKKLALSQKLVQLKTLESNDASQLIISELESHMENLKGEYLLGIINRIKQSKRNMQICQNTDFCALTADVSKNNMYEACKEVMKMFATLMK